MSKNIEDFSNVKLKTIDGNSIKLRDIINDKAFYNVDFWANWYGACVEELPYLKIAKKIS